MAFNPVEPSAELDWGRQAVIGKVAVDRTAAPAAKLFSKLLEVEILHEAVPYRVEQHGYDRDGPILR